MDMKSGPLEARKKEIYSTGRKQGRGVCVCLSSFSCNSADAVVGLPRGTVEEIGDWRIQDSVPRLYSHAFWIASMGFPPASYGFLVSGKLGMCDLSFFFI